MSDNAQEILAMTFLAIVLILGVRTCSAEASVTECLKAKGAPAECAKLGFP